MFVPIDQVLDAKRSSQVHIFDTHEPEGRKPLSDERRRYYRQPPEEETPLFAPSSDQQLKAQQVYEELGAITHPLLTNASYDVLK